jgi:hypothetical protein
MEGVLYFFNWKEFGNMSDRFPGHPGGIECITSLDQSLIVTGCEDGKIRSDCFVFCIICIDLFCSAVSLYPHRIMSIVGRTSSMPIQTLCTSCDTNYLIGTSSLQESLQLMDSQQLKLILNKKKKKGDQNKNNSFFEDLEKNEELEVDDNDEEESTDDDSDDDEMKKPPKKKKKKS